MLSFWIAYILTRPLGASIGDYLSQPRADGGLGLGTTVTSALFLGAILVVVVYLSADAHGRHRGARYGRRAPTHADVLVVAHETAATPALLEAIRARAARGPARFHLLVPNPAEHAELTEAEREHRSRRGAQLALALPLIDEAAGGAAHGLGLEPPRPDGRDRGDAARGRASTRSSSRPCRTASRAGLHVDLPHRVAHLGLPLTTVVTRRSTSSPGRQKRRRRRSHDPGSDGGPPGRFASNDAEMTRSAASPGRRGRRRPARRARARPPRRGLRVDAGRDGRGCARARRGDAAGRARRRHRPARRRRARRLPGAASARNPDAGAVPDRPRRARRPNLAGSTPAATTTSTKPFAFVELVARLQALLRRSRRGRRARGGRAAARPGHARVADGRRESPLTPTEFRLLAALLAGPGEAVRRRELVRAGWPHGAIVRDNTLDAYIARLRRKLEAPRAGARDRDRPRRRLPSRMTARAPATAAPRRGRGGRRGAWPCSSPASTSCSGEASTATRATSSARAPRRSSARSAFEHGRLTTGESSDARASDAYIWVFERRAPARARRARGAPSTRRRATLATGPTRFSDVPESRRASLRASRSSTAASASARSSPASRSRRTRRPAARAHRVARLRRPRPRSSSRRRGWLVAARSGRSSRMTRQAADWSEHDLDRRFALGPPHDELTELAATLDGLLDRLAASLRHERRFSAELSHELRTPLARVIAEAELALRREREPGRVPGRARGRSAATPISWRARRRAGRRCALRGRRRAVSRTPKRSPRSAGPPARALAERAKWRQVAAAERSASASTPTSPSASCSRSSRTPAATARAASASPSRGRTRRRLHGRGRRARRRRRRTRVIFEPASAAGRERQAGAGLGLALARRLARTV